MANFNNLLFYTLNGFAGQSAVFDRTIVFFAEYSAYFMVAGFLTLLVFSGISRLKKVTLMAGAIVATVVGRGIIVEGIRFFYHHPRPVAALAGVRTLFMESGYSFPSAHATFFFALSAVVYRYNKAWGAVFFLLSVLMGLARVAAGVHYPFDVLGGAILGVGIGFASCVAVDKFLLKNMV